VAGPAPSSAALWAARAGAAVTHWTDHIGEAVSLIATFESNEQAPPHTVVAAGFAELTPGEADTALIRLPRGRKRQEELLTLAAAMLRPMGRLVFVGAKNEGVRTALKDAQRIFGRAGIVTRKGGYHAGLAYRPTGDIPLPKLSFHSYEVTVDNAPAELRSCPGAFAADRLDVGAAALIEAMEVAPGTDVLDLGCGTGLVTLAAARRGARVTGTDVSARAVATALATLTANGVPEAAVHLCNGAAAVESASIDTVVTNPPFHTGHDIDFEVAQLFVAEAARVLRPGGELFLVANAFLDYESWLRDAFHHVDIASTTPQFRVWHAHHPK
jgi:16S rRNA (guanine1207-N2)-methyltransferase